MKANEEGLTHEEKIMFALLSVILIVAIGVLVVKNFSANERKLIEETPIKETNGQDNDATSDIETSKSYSNLIEETNDKRSNSTKTSTNRTYLAAVTKEEKKHSSSNNNKKEEDAKENKSEPVNIYNSWDIKKDVVTEAYANDTIKIDRNVILSNGQEATAQLTVRQLIDNTYMIVDISSGYLTLKPGTYKYYYTYAGITKEQTLTVYDYLNPESVSLINLKDEITDDSISNERYEHLNQIVKNTKISLTENQISLTVDEASSKSEIPIIITLPSNLKTDEIKSNILGISITNKSSNWHQELKDNQIIAWINLSIIKKSNVLLNLEIDNIKYVLSLNIKVDKNNTENKDDDKEQNESDKKDPIIEDIKEDNKTEEEPGQTILDNIEPNSPNNEDNSIIAVTPNNDSNASSLS